MLETIQESAARETPCPRLAETLAADNGDLLAAMVGHPWIRGLAAGTLPSAAFVIWAQQCRLFCLQERRALLHLRSVNPPAELDRQFGRLIADTEREPVKLAAMLRSMGETSDVAPRPACAGYSAAVRAAAGDGLLVGAAAILAVEQAYLDTWTAVAQAAAPGSRWHDWVLNWSGDPFRELVTSLGTAVSDLAGEPSPSMRARITEAFRCMYRWEHAFWDMCWTGQDWPELGERP
jgi:thiaminase (transcriptional activator TenA)